jgi:hypothetical protein
MSIHSAFISAAALILEEEPMPAPRTCHASVFRAMLLVVSLCSAAAGGAQNPPLAPTSDTTIVVPSGALHYTSVLIPAGVTVKFVAPGFGPGSLPGMPAMVLCDGDAIIHGTLSLTGDSTNTRPAGWVTTGQGAIGTLCPASGPGSLYPASGGSHAGSYGSVLPFSVEGGSLGGDVWIFTDPQCSQFGSITYGSKGGGTLVLLAGGRIEIDGMVTADGQSIVAGGYGCGSGGSILLHGDVGVTLLPGGTVTAQGGTGPFAPQPYPPQYSFGAPGYVRLDAWGAPPLIQGTVTPAPTVLELPYLRTQSQPRIGTTWSLDVFAPASTPVFLAASLTPGSGASTPFGPLGLDLATANYVALAIAQQSHDPFASVPIVIPNAQVLVGLSVWFQGLAVPAALPARLTNTLAAVVN